MSGSSKKVIFAALAGNALIAGLEKAIKKACPAVKRVFIEAERYV